MYFIQEYSGFFIGADGGINTDGLRLAMELEDIPLNERKELCKGISLYLNKALSESRKNIQWNKVSRGR